jgi:hypothetical protein
MVVLFVLGMVVVITRPGGQKPSYVTDCDDLSLSQRHFGSSPISSIQ